MRRKQPRLVQQQVVSEEEMVQAVHLGLLPKIQWNRSKWVAVVVVFRNLRNQVSVVWSRVRLRFRQ